MNPPESAWYYTLPDGSAGGPVSRSEIQRLIDGGEIDPADKVTPAHEPPDWRGPTDHQFTKKRPSDTKPMVSVSDRGASDPIADPPESTVGTLLFIIGCVALVGAGFVLINASIGDGGGWRQAPLIACITIGGLLLVAVGRMVQYLAEISHYAKHVAFMVADRDPPADG